MTRPVPELFRFLSRLLSLDPHFSTANHLIGDLLAVAPDTTVEHKRPLSLILAANLAGQSCSASTMTLLPFCHSSFFQ
jgi:hypothetical protein